MSITNKELTEAFLSPQMRRYFEKKLPEISPREVGVRVEETLKFLNIAAYCHGSIPVSQEIDDIWHLWILETREYQKLCASLQGGRFIHHSSNVYAACDDLAGELPMNELDDDVAVLGNYVLNYGRFESDRVKYWLLANHLVAACGWSVERLNEWLTAGTAVATATP